jgi:hypothetical protein
MTKLVFRVHPSINFARVGNSQEYNLSPESCAGELMHDNITVGGLPIKPGTEAEIIDASDLRDSSKGLKRQAARFKLFAYEVKGADEYPTKYKTVEVRIGSKLSNGKTVKEIVWTVHIANKKAAANLVVNSQGIGAYGKNKTPQLRNPEFYREKDSKYRIKELVIDHGPQSISNFSSAPVRFSKKTIPTYCDEHGRIRELQNYRKTFPTWGLHEPAGELDVIGELNVDNHGRLLVLPGFGRSACHYDDYSNPMSIPSDLNNAGWFDDTGDGPVKATVIYDDGTVEESFGAWVVCCPPAYAPQIPNVVSAWDDIYDVWVRKMSLSPEVYDKEKDGFLSLFKPSFKSDIKAIFGTVNFLRWTTLLPTMAIKAHEAVDRISATDNPDRTIMAGLNFVRNPNKEPEAHLGVPLMPLSLGDAGKSFLTVTKTQYFMLEQWSKGHFDPVETFNLGKGEYLDMAALKNCLGGRYVPGIEVSYTVRSTEIYINDWKTCHSGPFRILHKKLDYKKQDIENPLLSEGWLPLHDMKDGLEPGDLTKFMAVPWQTDYNSCSIHQPSINIPEYLDKTNGNEFTLYWSWPSQRPDSVHVATEVKNNVLPKQKWAFRGPGTYSINPAFASSFQKPMQSVTDWHKLGIVIQGTKFSEELLPEYYLEVLCLMEDKGEADNPVLDWPFNANPYD